MNARYNRLEDNELAREDIKPAYRGSKTLIVAGAYSGRETGDLALVVRGINSRAINLLRNYEASERPSQIKSLLALPGETDFLTQFAETDLASSTAGN